MANELKKPKFSMTEEQLAAAIKQYKDDVASGAIARASWPHFCATLDYTEKDLADVIEFDRVIEKSAYNGRALLLKKMLTWCRGQMLSAPGWNGQMTTRAIFCLKQDYGDEVVYRDRDNGGEKGTIDVRVSFGGGDKRGDKAGK